MKKEYFFVIISAIIIFAITLIAGCAGGGAGGGSDTGGSNPAEPTETTVPSETPTETPSATPTGKVSGTVSDDLNRPVYGAKVSITLEHRVLETYTNSLGEFTLEGVPEGDWFLTIEAAGFDTWQQEIEVVANATTGVAVGMATPTPEPSTAPTGTPTETPTPEPSTAPTGTPTETPTPEPIPAPTSTPTPEGATVKIILVTDATQASAQIYTNGLPEGNPQIFIKDGDVFKVTLYGVSTGDRAIKIFNLGEGYNTSYNYLRRIYEGVNEFTFTIYKKKE